MTNAAATLLNPAILFFVLGAIAAFVRSDLAIPEAVTKGLSLYLMASIGLKGGVAVATAGLTGEMFAAGAAGLALSLLLPVPAFVALRRAGLGMTDAAATAAHYGSVSVVTFVTGSEVLTGQGLAPAGYMVAVLALMETPAIISGLLLARRATSHGIATTAHTPTHEMLREVFANGSVMLLVGSFAIGAIIGKDKFTSIAPVFDTGFKGILCLFLLDMGLVAARRLQGARLLTPALVGLAIALPLVNGSIGVLVGHAIGLDTGSVAALGILAGSASYIAVPAAMRLALPQADPGIYLPMSLGISFPFNIIFGIAIYTALAERFAA
ncbi:sodium-dependent bicarbonate transport family permease [Polymorphobacter arshaanensis]|uniref:Sodium-dependent bicarbonate transport family permease n=1 Tax=Glacieibacterium arshaanense TaxID=2511025 RepID=A0A4Y9ESV4_9SPHN|nr:sodium-dependent bicarbonate transport family permease [Polymorphobacter arshaanensis]TFU06552.1 sodium-dependent bicarbonate transport family permease [Polymorphobacter arshaanensis]